MNYPYLCTNSTTHRPEPGDIHRSRCTTCGHSIVRRCVRRGRNLQESVYSWAASIIIKEWP